MKLNERRKIIRALQDFKPGMESESTFNQDLLFIMMAATGIVAWIFIVILFFKDAYDVILKILCN